MCRIVGCWEYSRPEMLSKETVISMRDTMIHGGPDDEGLYIDPESGLGLGHRRLSILELSGLGHQPMISQNGRFHIVYNGEVYNFREIQRDLVGRGHSFNGDSDTEVVLAALSEWGIDAIQRFIGMFAFALWDTQHRELTLVRDRLGVKPLYWSNERGRFIFASEIKAFLRHPNFDKSVSAEAVREFFQFGYIGRERSIFSSIHKLLPGQMLRISADGIPHLSTYWSLMDSVMRPKLNMKSTELIDELEDRLKKAFKYRMVSDVPVGVFLSGGIDSSLVTALLASESPSQLRTFSIGFSERDFDESQYAQQVADALGTDHTTEMCSIQDLLRLLPEMPAVFDEPLGDCSVIPTFMVCKMASQSVKVVLSADAGDEQFAGYRNYRYLDNLERLETIVPRSAIRGMTHFLAKNPRIPIRYQRRFSKLGSMMTSSQSKEGRHRDLATLYTPQELNQLVPNSRIGRVAEPLPNHADVGLLMDLLNYLPDNILVKVDRASMANSIEARDPFVDHKLIEWTSQLPYSEKIKGGYQKELLRRVLGRHIPRSLFERPKKGFSIPLDQWLRHDAATYRRTLLSESKLKKITCIDAHVALELQRRFELGDPQINAQHIWRLMVLTAWWVFWIDRS